MEETLHFHCIPLAGGWKIHLSISARQKLWNGLKIGILLTSKCSSFDIWNMKNFVRTTFHHCYSSLDIYVNDFYWRHFLRQWHTKLRIVVCGPHVGCTRTLVSQQQTYNTIDLTLKMAQVVETSVTTNNYFQLPSPRKITQGELVITIFLWRSLPKWSHGELGPMPNGAIINMCLSLFTQYIAIVWKICILGYF